MDSNIDASFTPSSEQQEAMDSISAWYRSPWSGSHSQEPGVFRLYGYAGTGKSSVAQHIVAMLGLSPGEVVDASEPDDTSDLDSDDDDFDSGFRPLFRREIVTASGFSSEGSHALYAAYTGKAAHVLTRKGAPASTLHRLLYKVIEKDDDELRRLQRELSGVESSSGLSSSALAREVTRLRKAIRAEKRRISTPRFVFDPDSPIGQASLLVIDEVSMVDASMARDILSFSTPVLVLGDPAQLPPVGGEGYFTAREPDHLLTHVHRFALDSPVGALATSVRTSPVGDRSLGAGPRSPSSVPGMLSSDIVLCFKNNTRWALIDSIRSSYGRSRGLLYSPADPQGADQIIILRNNYDIGVFNGQIFTVLLVMEGNADSPVYELLVLDDDGNMRTLVVLSSGFSEPDGELDAKAARGVPGDVAIATYAQVITCHKSQGSEWESVYVLDETRSLYGMNYHRAVASGMDTDSARSHAHSEARRWLYTAVSRAKTHITVAV